MDHSPGFLKLAEDARTRVREMSIEEVRGQLQNERVTLLDVREESEWAAGHVSGAEHLGRGVLERDIEKRIPDKSAGIILYCGGGYRSALAADALQRMGYTQVVSMAGGWRAWEAAGGPIEK